MFAIKAELRKLFTVRSTYILLGLCLGLEVLFAFYGDGIKATSASLHSPDMLAHEVTQAVSALATIIALVGVLLVTHEYRYNTIMYTLTSSNRRAKILLAKLLVITLFAMMAAVIFGFLSPVFADLGLHIKGHQLVHQTFPVWNLLWRAVFVGWGFSMLALIIAFIIRVQIGAFVAVFLISGTVEPLLGLLLKQNQDYLPFTALSSILEHKSADISPGRAALVAALYIVIGWIVAGILFLQRDAN
jgi:hypothetical protein